MHILIIDSNIQMRYTLLLLLSTVWVSLIFGQNNISKSTKAEVASQLLTLQLDTIYHDDQDGRVISDSLQKLYGWQAKEIVDRWRDIEVKDSVNQMKVCAIIDRYGWIGTNVIGQRGNTTLFLVIQHASLATQQKYLPLLRDAVKKGNASGSDLALMEDRIALRTGRKQIYGSQISAYEGENRYYVSPLEDPDNVDKRRTGVGLRPMSVYLSYWNMKWDLEQYKKDLPMIEAKEKAQYNRVQIK